MNDNQEIPNEDLCDESKCVSTGLSSRYNYTFTCYGDDGLFYPMMCADGYQPHPIEGIPLVSESSYPYWAQFMNDDGPNISLQYFTCCPPHDLPRNETSLMRHCSDPIPMNSNGEDDTEGMICSDGGDNTTRLFPREMKTSRVITNNVRGGFELDRHTVQSYMCCDSPSFPNENWTSSFLEGMDCVPYQDTHYHHRGVHNDIGRLLPIECNFQPMEGFAFPTAVRQTRQLQNDTIFYYECCKSIGPMTVSQPFIQDVAFAITLYPMIVIASVALVSSLILILGLSIPLYFQVNQRSKGAFSSYLLYLVYLAIPDFAFHVYKLAIYTYTASQHYCDTFHLLMVVPLDIDTTINKVEYGLVNFYVATNLYLNAVIANEILILLKNSHKMRRCAPPTLMRVTAQAFSVYTWTLVISILRWIIHVENTTPMTKLALDQMLTVLAIVLPIGYVLYVIFVIWWCGYMPPITALQSHDSSVKNRALRNLTWYFFRIIAVFLLCWVPGTVFMVIGMETPDTWVYIVMGMLYSLQPILSTMLAMTNPDVRRYVTDLVKLSCLRCDTHS